MAGLQLSVDGDFQGWAFGRLWASGDGMRNAGRRTRACQMIERMIMGTHFIVFICEVRLFDDPDPNFELVRELLERPSVRLRVRPARRVVPGKEAPELKVVSATCTTSALWPRMRRRVRVVQVPGVRVG